MLYPKKSKNRISSTDEKIEKEEVDDGDSDSESVDGENSAFDIDEESETCEETHEIFPLIAKIRKVVKIPIS